jgi:hypothetical protein
MKALALRNHSLIKKLLLQRADETPGGMDLYTHCRLVFGSVRLEIDSGRRTVHFDPLGGGKMDMTSRIKNTA